MLLSFLKIHTKVCSRPSCIKIVLLHIIPLQAITTELESKEELIEEMMKESEYLLSLADNDHLYVIPADLGDKVTSFRSDWKVSRPNNPEKR